MNKDREGIVWGLMTDEEKAELKNAEHVECYHDGEWVYIPANIRMWCNHSAYRVKPEPELWICEKSDLARGHDRPHLLNEWCYRHKCVPCVAKTTKPEMMICSQCYDSIAKGTCRHEKPHEYDCSCLVHKCIPYVPEAVKSTEIKDKHYPEERTDAKGRKQLHCVCGNTSPCEYAKPALELPEFDLVKDGLRYVAIKGDCHQCVFITADKKCRIPSDCKIHGDFCYAIFAPAPGPAVELPEGLKQTWTGLSYVEGEMFDKINELCREIRYLKAEKEKGV